MVLTGVCVLAATQASAKVSMAALKSIVPVIGHGFCGKLDPISGWVEGQQQPPQPLVDLAGCTHQNIGGVWGEDDLG